VTPLLLHVGRVVEGMLTAGPGALWHGFLAAVVQMSVRPPHAHSKVAMLSVVQIDQLIFILAST